MADYKRQNANGFTLLAWLHAAGVSDAQNVTRVLIAAWKEGHDPSEYRAIDWRKVHV